MNLHIEIIPGSYFIAVPKTVGTSHEEIDAMANGDVPDIRRREIAEKLRLAAAELNMRDTMGRC